MENTVPALWQKIWESQHPLIVIPNTQNIDACAASIALAHALHDAGKTPDIICKELPPQKIHFLIKHLEIKKDLETYIRYEAHIPEGLEPLLKKNNDGTTTITLRGTSAITPTSFTSMFPAWDCIITLGATPADIAPLFHAHPEILINIPHTNIEILQKNNATTLCESMTHLMETAGICKEHSATCLLTGLIGLTKNLRNERVTPALLTTCATLITKGAERKKILQELYKVQTLENMRLWGKACARLEERTGGIFFSFIGSIEEEKDIHTRLSEVGQEILSSTDGCEKIVFVFDEDMHRKAYVLTKSSQNACAFLGAEKIEGTKSEALHTFLHEKTCEDIKKLLI